MIVFTSSFKNTAKYSLVRIKKQNDQKKKTKEKNLTPLRTVGKLSVSFCIGAILQILF